MGISKAPLLLLAFFPKATKKGQGFILSSSSSSFVLVFRSQAAASPGAGSLDQHLKLAI
jgi:hypothetical protein